MRKRFFHILILLIGGLLSSCTTEKQYTDPRETYALLGITVITDGAYEDDYIRQARYITFDNASFSPRLDVNQVIAFTGAEQEATEFSTELKVSRNDDKMVLVILNEPAELTPVLNGVKTLAELSDLNFQMASVFGYEHQAPGSSGLPMTGTVRGIAVTAANTESNPAQARVTVTRSVARFELWLKTDPGVIASVEPQTGVVLSRTTDIGYLFKPEPAYGFGQLQTVPSPTTTVSWNYLGGVPQELDENAQFVCAFYIPERTATAPWDADKLVLDIWQVNTLSGPRNLHVTLSEFSTGGGPLVPVTLYERNNIYRLTGRVKDLGIEFEHTVIPWNEIDESVIIDPQYYLRVSSDDVMLAYPTGTPTSIVARTDYNRDDRGYPAGIVLGNLVYYDPDGVEITSGPYYGWVDVEALGAEGSLTREIRFTARDYLTSDRGYYAKLEVKAGNAVKLIRVHPILLLPN